MDAMPSEYELRRQICETGRRMYAKGFVAANDGNISVRLGGGRYLCTPTGVSKGFLKPEDLAVVNDAGKQLSGPLPRTSEVLLHLEIYHELPEVSAVCHAHPPHATAFAVAGIAPPVGVLPEVEILLGPVPLAPYETPGSKDFAQTILPHLRNKANTILLANHGAVACDKTLERTFFHLETVDMYCQILLLARQVGRVSVMPQEKVGELLEIKKRLGINDPRFGDSLEQIVSLPGADDFLKGFSTVAIPQHQAGPGGSGHGAGIEGASSQRNEPQPLPAIVAGRRVGGGLGSSSQTARKRAIDDQIERLTQVITDRIVEMMKT